jgi:hypothetical protein
MLRQSKNLAKRMIPACLLLIGLLLSPPTSIRAADPPPDRSAAQRRLMQDAGTGSELLVITQIFKKEDKASSL